MAMLHPDVTSGEHYRHSWHIEAPYLGTLSSPPRPWRGLRLEAAGRKVEISGILTHWLMKAARDESDGNLPSRYRCS